MEQDIIIVPGMEDIIILVPIPGDSICSTTPGPDGDLDSILILVGSILALEIIVHGHIMVVGGALQFIVLLTAGLPTGQDIMEAIMVDTTVITDTVIL